MSCFTLAQHDTFEQFSIAYHFHDIIHEHITLYIGERKTVPLNLRNRHFLKLDDFTPQELPQHPCVRLVRVDEVLGVAERLLRAVKD